MKLFQLKWQKETIYIHGFDTSLAHDLSHFLAIPISISNTSTEIKPDIEVHYVNPSYRIQSDNDKIQFNQKNDCLYYLMGIITRLIFKKNSIFSALCGGVPLSIKSKSHFSP